MFTAKANYSSLATSITEYADFDNGKSFLLEIFRTTNFKVLKYYNKYT